MCIPCSMIIMLANPALTRAQGDSMVIRDLGTSTISSEPIDSAGATSTLLDTRADQNPKAATVLTVTDLLWTMPGFTETMSFQAPLVLRGLAGNRLLVLRDGMRQDNSYASGYMLHTTPMGSLEGIKVGKGLGSVRYGSGAMAGTIELQSASPPTDQKLHGTYKAQYASNAQEFGSQGNWAYGTPQAGVRANLQVRNASAYHYSGDSLARNSDFQDRDADWTAVWNPGSNQQLRYTGSWHQGGPWGKPQGFTGTRYLIARTPVEDLYRHTGEYRYWQGGVLQEVPVSVTYGYEKRTHDFLYLDAGSLENSYRETVYYRFATMGVRTEPLWQVAPRWQIRTGAEAFRSVIHSPLYVTDYYEGLSFRNRQQQGARSLSGAAYGESDWQWSSGYTARAGIRIDRTQLYEGSFYDTSRTAPGQVTFAAGSGLLALGKKWGSRHRTTFQLARTYRVPQPGEMFGQTMSGNGVVVGNPSLQPEKGYAADLSWTWQSSWGHYEATPFFWIVDDMIGKEIRAGKGIVYEYRNVGRVRLWGGETTFRSQAWQLPLHSQWNFHVGSALVQGADISASSPFAKGSSWDERPPWRMLYGLQWSERGKRVARWSMAAEVDHYPGPAYARLDIRTRLDFQDLHRVWPRIDIAVQNATDTRYTPFNSLVPAKGRDYRCAFTWQL